MGKMGVWKRTLLRGVCVFEGVHLRWMRRCVSAGGGGGRVWCQHAV